MSTSRRAFLRGTATGAGVATGLVAIGPPAAASHPEHQPDHVTISFDRAMLEQYRPRLVLSSDARERLLGLYGWKATSSEYETDACVYWASYTHQSGVTSYDSHYGDHEPVYVFVDSSGAVSGVAASVYHWLRGWTGSPRLDGDHPQLRVIEPWHQYTAATQTGSLVDVEDLTTVFDSWLANGLEDSLAPGTVYDPWTMLGAGGRPHWWRNDVGHVSLTATWLSIQRALGVGVAGSL